jgi:hypothetical protein
MQSQSRPKTKRDARRQMQSLMERRERSTPERQSPDWIQRFWKGMAT